MNVREWTHFRMRIRPDLHDQVKANAAANYRSINSELTMILERHFAETKKAPGSRQASPDASDQ